MALEKIQDFKGIHEGKRLFILASGPSLTTLDLSKLKRRLVMGLNRSFLTYTDTQYHCCMDHRLFELHPDGLRQSRYLFTLEGRPWGIPLKLLGAEGFSQNLAEGVYTGYTISFLALQIALYLGFHEVFFLGLDLCNQGINTHFFGADFHSRNHATTEYPKMKRMFELAAKELKGGAMTVYNCSPVSTLECFEKLSFDEAVAR